MAYSGFKHSSLTRTALWSQREVCDFVCRVLEELQVQGATICFSPGNYDERIFITIPHQACGWVGHSDLNHIPLIQQLGASKGVGVTANCKEIQIEIPLPLYKKGGMVYPEANQQITLKVDEVYKGTLYKLLFNELSQNLEALDVKAYHVDFPSVGSSSCRISPGPPHLYPCLTTFEFKSSSRLVAFTFEHNLLEFLRNCPKLECVCLEYGDKGKVSKFPTGNEAPKLVELHSLCWFSHKSPNEVMPMGIFNRLSLKKTCNVLLEFKDQSKEPWDRNFPVIHDQSHLSGETTVKITCHNPYFRNFSRIRVKFSNSDHEFSIQVTASPMYLGAAGVKKILPFLGRCGGIKVLHFEGCMLGKARQVTSVFKQVNAIVKSRRANDVPLQTVRVTTMDMEKWLELYKKSLKVLKEPAVEMIESRKNSCNPNGVQLSANQGSFARVLQCLVDRILNQNIF